MIIQLQHYPVTVDGQERGASSAYEYEIVARLVRWILLNESDWIMGNDSPASPEAKEQWRLWRQGIRDLPQTFPSPMTETLEIPDPPVSYYPPTWINLTPEAGWHNSVPHIHDGDTEPHSH